MKPSTLGHLIRSKREAQGLSRPQIAELAKCSVSTVEKAEAGTASAKTLAKVAQAVGLEAVRK